MKKDILIKELEKPKKIIWEKKTQTYGKLIAEPLERGYGITIGNALRRILLSSLPGAAVSAVKIEGVLHEFSTIPGVLEDVLNIILNLKGLLVKLDSEEESALVYIKAKGIKEVKADDIITDKRVKILNPDLHIATLTDSSASLQMEITIRRGRGYVPSEMNKREDMPIGVIPVDSLFSPVRRVSYTVEETRVGQITNYDRLIMEIWTDGRLTPQEALISSAKILRDYISIFFDLKEGEREEIIQDEKEELRKKILEQSVEELEPSVRVSKCFRALNINTIGDVIQKTEKEFLKMKNFGKKSLNEIKEKLKKLGLSLADEKGK